MHAFIGLGSNLGDRLSQLRHAAAALAALGRVLGRSAVYETVPHLDAASPPHPDYLNAALWLETELAPLSLLERLLGIEHSAGRRRPPGTGPAPRTLDLDVLLLGQGGDLVLVSESLVVPHPRLHLRAFALRPLLDLVPGLVHPALSLPLRVLYQMLPDDEPPPRPLGWL